MADAVTQQTWAASLLQRLGIPQSPGAIQAIVGWEQAEGGHWSNTARYNPLNTTQPMPGAGNTGTQGNIKVYTSWSQGLDATAKTLQNGHYGGILTALRAGDPSGTAAAIGASPWGTSGALVSKTIGQTGRPSGRVSSAGTGTPAAAAVAASVPASSTSAGATLFGDDKVSGLKYAAVWLVVIIGGLAIIGAGFNRALGGAPARSARRAGTRAAIAAAV